MRESASSSWPSPHASASKGAGERNPDKGLNIQTVATSWASPQARLGDNRRSPQAKRWGCEKRHGGWNLDDQVAALWPTPSAALTNDGEEPETFMARQNRLKEKGINGNGAGMPLTVAAKLSTWPTASARDWKSGDASAATMERNARPLNEVVEQWGTPSTMDAKGRAYTRDGGEESKERMALVGQAESFRTTLQDPVNENSGQPSLPNTRTLLRLAPEFVEWLMGWPIGWTIPAPGSEQLGQTGCGPPEMGWSRWLPRQRIWLSMLSSRAEPRTTEPELRQMSLL